jgi:hypothetical protein
MMLAEGQRCMRARPAKPFDSSTARTRFRDRAKTLANPAPSAQTRR